MSNLKILTFLAFTFIASGIVSGDSFSEELVVASTEGGFYRLTIENATLIGETELIPPISTFATRPHCSTCGATYNGLLFDNWYFLPGLNGTILGLKSTQFDNLTFTSWKLGDCEPLALGVHNASNILYISCVTNNNTVGLRVVDYVSGGEPVSVAFEINSSVSNEYTKSSSENLEIFVEYNRSYHLVSSVGNDLLIHKLDGLFVKHLGTYSALCSSSMISDIAVLEDNASLVTRCGNGEIYIFNLHSANFIPINNSLSTEPDSNIQYEILVSYSGSYVAILSSKEITVFATSSWVFATISDHNNSITSLTFVESEGSVLIVYTVAGVGVYTYNVTGALIHGIGTVSIMIPGSKSVCSVDGCIGITSVGSLAVAAEISGGLLFYSFSSTSVTTYGPYVTDYNITLVVPSFLSLNNTMVTPSMPIISDVGVLGIVITVTVLVFTFGVVFAFALICVLVRKKSKLRIRYLKSARYSHLKNDCRYPIISPSVEVVYTGTCDELLFSVLDPVTDRVNSFPKPPEVGECVPLVGDVLKQAGCFVLGEIQTITIPETGGEWNLYPFPNDKRETCAMLSAPPGVVASGETVVIMYGIIPSGPFVFPDGLELASVLIYLDCNDKEKLQKPLSLLLKHCITMDDKVLQNSLCFVKASHTPQDGSFVFESKSNAVFDSESGTLEFTDFCLNGICVKKACEEIEKIGTRCYAIPCTIQPHSTEVLYRICLVLRLPSWEDVFREHYCTPREYSRKIDMHKVVEFKADEPIHSFVSESDMKGNGWQMMELHGSVKFTNLESALLELREMNCEQITRELNRGLVFPHFEYVIIYDRETNTVTHGGRMVRLTLRGCKLEDTHFYISVREELRRERTLEGAEDGEGMSRAVRPQSHMEGFIPQGTFKERFLDWTPSDMGLLEVVEKGASNWWKIAIFLGVPFETVNAVTSEQDHVKVLKQWRDGMKGCRTPFTWETLLGAVKKVLGVNVHDELQKEVMENEFLSIRKETRH